MDKHLSGSLPFAPHDKSAWRKYLRGLRKSLPPAQRRRAEAAVCRRLQAWIKRGRRIAVYAAAGSELDLAAFVRTAWARGADIYFPCVEARTRRLRFVPEGAAAGRSRRFAGVCGGRRAEEMAVVLLPLVGADAAGGRLGQGGGYYDASLSVRRGGRRTVKIGVGFACQLAERLPVLAHDVRLDYFVCERGIYKF